MFFGLRDQQLTPDVVSYNAAMDACNSPPKPLSLALFISVIRFASFVLIVGSIIIILAQITFLVITIIVAILL